MILNKLSLDKEINVVGLNIIDTNEAEVRKFMEKFEVKYTLKFDLNSPLKNLGIIAFPTVIIFNPANKKFRIKTGFNEDDNFLELRELIDSIQN